ncbi:DUF4124 domain-containing protein [Nocardia sp. NPDC050712]|uniref:DUF4124 domain-containing protein n=1 Tax=Nocardia sp. NPDC050712 TaxID=3155518 RepID=UPI0034043C41
MIKTWTDEAGVTHYADEHSKAYRKRTEPGEGKAQTTVVVDTPAEPTDTRRARTKTDETAAG